MKSLKWLALALAALMAFPVFAGAQSVVGPSTFTFTAASQSNVWSCTGGQSSFQLTVPSGLTGTFTVTVAQTNSGTYVNPPWSNAPGVATYVNTITNSGALTVTLGSNYYVKVADTAYTSGSATVTGSCSAANPGGAAGAGGAAATPIPWTSASPAPVSCVAVAAVGTCATPIPWSQSSPLPISLPTSFPGNFPTPIPYPTSSTMPGTLRQVQVGPSTAPAAANGGYDAVIDSNGRTATRNCDATTSTQCLAVSAGGVASVHDAAPVQPSPIYTMPVSLNTSAPLPVSTASANPLPTASAGAAPPGNAPHVVAWLACMASAGSAPSTTGGNGQAALCPNGILQVNTPAPQPTMATNLYQGVVRVGPSTAPAAVNSAYTAVVDSNGRAATRTCDGTTSTQCQAVSAGGVASVTTPAPVPTAGSPTNVSAGIIPVATNSNGNPVALIMCLNFALSVNISTNTTTSIVAASNGKTTYVCDFDLYIVSGTTPSFKFIEGTTTTTPCDTGSANLTGTFGGIAGAVGQNFAMGTGVGSLFQTQASQQLCLVSGGTSPNIQGFIEYAQF